MFIINMQQMFSNMSVGNLLIATLYLFTFDNKATLFWVNYLWLVWIMLPLKVNLNILDKSRI